MARVIAICALVLVLGCFNSAHAWSYVGCFTRDKISVQQSASGTTSSACVDSCWNTYGIALGMLSGDGQCECTGLIPNTDAQVEDVECEGEYPATLARMYYRNIADPKSSCRLAPVPMLSNTAFSVRGDRSTAAQYFPNGTVALSLVGTIGTTAIGLYPTGFGMYSMLMNIDMTPGVISAFYLTTDPNTEFKEKSQRTQEEIDVEFINAHPAKGPGCIWTNTWVDGKALGPEHCGKMTDINKWHTYTVDWQPDNITWYFNGDKFDQRDKNNGTIPSKDQVMAFTIWTMDHVDFGGVAPGGTHWSYFADMRRLLCDDVRPDPAVAAPAVAPANRPTAANITANTTATVKANTTAPTATANTTAANTTTTRTTTANEVTPATSSSSVTNTPTASMINATMPTVNVAPIRNGAAAVLPITAAALLAPLLLLLL